MTNFLKLTVALAFTAAAGSASATNYVSTYAGISGNIEGPGVYVEDSVITTAPSGVFWGWPDPGQVHLDPSGFAGNTSIITFAGGSFNLVSFDVSYSSFGLVEVTGYDAADVQTYFTSFTPSSLATISFTGWTGLGSVKIVDLNQHFSFDNMTLSAAVPEPASWALMIAGFGLVGGAMRRRTATVVAV